MYKYEVSIVHNDETKNEIVNRQTFTVEVEGDLETEDMIPYCINKRNSDATRTAITKYLDEISVFEGDSLYIEQVKRVQVTE